MFDDMMRIKTWHFSIRQHREVLPRSILAMHVSCRVNKPLFNTQIHVPCVQLVITCFFICLFFFPLSSRIPRCLISWLKISPDVGCPTPRSTTSVYANFLLDLLFFFFFFGNILVNYLCLEQSNIYHSTLASLIFP